MKKDHLKTQLQFIIDNQPNTLKAFVAQEAIEQENIEDFFSDLQQHGCISGMISPLIYYKDTHQFFDDYYSEIEQLREDTEDSLGEPIQIKGDLKNTLAWFAFEETAYQMSLNLEIKP
ncbi:DUF7222 domain-containing protein [Psychroserpens sp.]